MDVVPVVCRTGGAAATAVPQAGVDVMGEATSTSAAEEEREALISAGEQAEMWAP